MEGDIYIPAVTTLERRVYNLEQRVAKLEDTVAQLIDGINKAVHSATMRELEEK